MTTGYRAPLMPTLARLSNASRNVNGVLPRVLPTRLRIADEFNPTVDPVQSQPYVVSMVEQLNPTFTQYSHVWP